MIAIAPPELCSGLTQGQTVKLGELITRANIRDHISNNQPAATALLTSQHYPHWEILLSK